ncbi:hypothetical protein ACLK1W_04980 [Escherichia coli]
MNYRIIPVTAFSQQNCSLIWCEQTRLAALVDPGGDAEKIKQEVDDSGLTTTDRRRMVIWTTLAQRRNWRNITACQFLARKKKMSSGCKACLRKVVCLVWKSASR